MRNDTRQTYNDYLARIATLNGIAATDTAQQFSVAPSVQQKLESAMQESSAFLSRINIAAVDDLQGQKLGLSLSGPAASRTDTATKERKTRDLTALAAQGYHCHKTNFDTHLTYAKLDAWAKFPDFQQRIARLLVERREGERERITIRAYPRR